MSKLGRVGGSTWIHSLWFPGMAGWGGAFEWGVETQLVVRIAFIEQEAQASSLIKVSIKGNKEQ